MLINIRHQLYQKVVQCLVPKMNKRTTIIIGIIVSSIKNTPLNFGVKNSTYKN